MDVLLAFHISKALYHVSKFKFLWSFCFTFFLVFLCSVQQIQACDLTDLAEGIICSKSTLIYCIGWELSDDAKPAMVCTANDLQGWKDFPKGLRVLVLDGDRSSAAEIGEQLEAMDYHGETFWIPLFFIFGMFHIFLKLWHC